MSNETTWERTSVQSLLRNRKSGRYYGRWTISGKQKWVSLDTDVFTVAKLRLNDEAAKIERQRGTSAAVASGGATVGDLLTAYTQAIERRGREKGGDLAPKSVAAYLQAVAKIRKTWPALAALKPGRVTAEAVIEWAERFKADGTAFRPPGAKTEIKGNSARSVNKAIDALRHVMDLAVEAGAIHSNPVAAAAARLSKGIRARLKKKVERKKLHLPTLAQVHQIYSAMENNGARGGWGVEAADFCRFLAFSGARVGEVATITWACIDWEKKELQIRGYKTETSDRIVPLFPDLAALLRKVQERRKLAARFAVNGKPFLEASDKIFRISECQKTIDAACAKVAVPRLTHHDFRHLFATRCIESGVDIPTVSRWLGHSDGGALAMKTYGHLRQEHSQAQASKVRF